MRIPGIRTLKKATMWLRNRIYPGAIILGYHRITKVDIDCFESCVSPDHFAQQMEIISRCTNTGSLGNLTASLESGAPLSRMVCVTFDDGYADTLNTAKPILELYNVPATVFVTAGNLGEEFWWDELERTILEAPERVVPLRLECDGIEFEWDLSGLNAVKRASQISAIANFLRPLDSENRDQQLKKIREWAGAGVKSSPVRSMTPDELLSLLDGELIEIGSHSVTHPMFTELPESLRRYEIEASKFSLEAITSRPVLGFSFPNGRYLAGDPGLIRQSGYRYACVSKNGVVRQAGDLFTLPRFWPKDIGGDQFQRWLFRWIKS